MITSPHHLGDFVAKVALIRLLKQGYPHCQIILCARCYVFELAKRVTEIDEIIDLDHLFSKEDDAIVEDLKSLKIDVLIHILSVDRSMGPHVFKYAQKANIPFRVGNCNRSLWSLYFKNAYKGLTHNLRQKRIMEGVHEFQWNLTPLKFFNLRSNYSLDEIADYLLVPKKKMQHPLLVPNRFNLIVHPGSHGNAKEWPVKNFLTLINSLNDPSIQIIITGSAEEARRYSMLNVKKEGVTFAMGELNLKDFISLIENADGIVAASTGPIHMASLFGTKTLGLFPKQKEMSAQVWSPVGHNADYLESPIICLACQKKLTELNPKACRCMEGIEVDQVFNVIKGWKMYESVI